VTKLHYFKFYTVMHSYRTSWQQTAKLYYVVFGTKSCATKHEIMLHAMSSTQWTAIDTAVRQRCTHLRVLLKWKAVTLDTNRASEDSLVANSSLGALPYWWLVNVLISCLPQSRVDPKVQGLKIVINNDGDY